MTILLSDPRVSAIPVRDHGEPLVRLDPRLGRRSFVRATLADRLLEARNLPFAHASDATFHLWTLATEEQFYLVRPAVLAVLSVVPLRGPALTYLAGGPAIALLTAAVLLAWRGWVDVTTPVLRPLVWLGTVSCAAYLWNYPLTLWLRPHLGVAAGVTAAAGTLVLAAVSWRLVERPTHATQEVLVS